MKNKKALGMFTLLILFTAFIIGYAASTQIDFDVNKFKSVLNWTPINIPIEQSPELGNALTYYINGVGAAFFEICKWVAQWASENPNVPWKLLIVFLILTLVLPVVWYLFKFLIIIFLLIK